MCMRQRSKSIIQPFPAESNRVLWALRSTWSSPSRWERATSGPVGGAPAQVARGHRHRHRALAPQQFAQQAELGEAAGAVRAAPQVAVAAEAGGHAAAQVLAQHQRAMAGLDEPGPAAAAAAHF